MPPFTGKAGTGREGIVLQDSTRRDASPEGAYSGLVSPGNADAAGRSTAAFLLTAAG